jgi:hypothetical protein
MSDAAARINELDTVVLRTALPAEGLDVGALGTVVRVLDDGARLEIEFSGAGGRASTPVTLAAAQVRRSTGEDA